LNAVKNRLEQFQAFIRLRRRGLMRWDLVGHSEILACRKGSGGANRRELSVKFMAANVVPILVILRTEKVTKKVTKP
jgi:hypothetical protein